MDTIQRVVRAYPTRLPCVLYDRIAIDQRAWRGDPLTDATVATCLGRLKISAPGTSASCARLRWQTPTP